MNNSFTRPIFNESKTTRHHREERGLSSWWIARAVRKTIFLLALGGPLLTATTANANNGQLTDCDSANGCLISALTSLVGGFTGAAGNQLWGWMLGGSQSAGVANIQPELESIESTLTTIENELGPTGRSFNSWKNCSALKTAAGSIAVRRPPSTAGMPVTPIS